MSFGTAVGAGAGLIKKTPRSVSWFASPAGRGLLASTLAARVLGFRDQPASAEATLLKQPKLKDVQMEYLLSSVWPNGEPATNSKKMAQGTRETDDATIALINQLLKDDVQLAHLLPLREPADLYEAVKDGLLLCKLVNLAEVRRPAPARILPSCLSLVNPLCSRTPSTSGSST